MTSNSNSSTMPQDMALRMQAIISKHGEAYRKDLPGLIQQMHFYVERFAEAKGNDVDLIATLEREAHDMKGQAATFGMPGISAVANSLSRMLESAPVFSPALAAAMESHVSALKKLLEQDDQKLVDATLATAQAIPK